MYDFFAPYIPRKLRCRYRRHRRHVDLDHHGYSFVRITKDQAQMHWLRVDNVLRHDSGVRFKA